MRVHQKRQSFDFVRNKNGHSFTLLCDTFHSILQGLTLGGKKKHCNKNFHKSSSHDISVYIYSFYTCQKSSAQR